MSSDTGIHVSDPIHREEVCVTRGSDCIYLVRFEDETRYAVLDEDGNDTGHTWSGDIWGVSDFHALAGLIDTITSKEA
jgi:hypothetical protein